MKNAQKELPKTMLRGSLITMVICLDYEKQISNHS